MEGMETVPGVGAGASVARGARPAGSRVCPVVGRVLGVRHGGRAVWLRAHPQDWFVTPVTAVLVYAAQVAFWRMLRFGGPREASRSRAACWGRGLWG